MSDLDPRRGHSTAVPTSEAHTAVAVERQIGRGAFADLVSWALETVVPDRLAHRDRMLTIARSVDHRVGPGYQIGGFEVHHDGSGTVDLLLHCLAGRTQFDPALRLPTYFADLAALAVGDPGAAESSPLDARPSALGPLPQHWLEFDQIDHDLVLAGIWQALGDGEGAGTHECLAAVTEVLAVAGVDAERLHGSRRLRHFLDCFGLPGQIGIMSGRAGEIKLFRVVSDGQDATETLSRFLDHEDLAADRATAATSDPEHLAEALCGLAATHDGVTIGVNLDLDVDRDRFSWGVGLEIHMPDVGSRLRSVSDDGDRDESRSDAPTPIAPDPIPSVLGDLDEMMASHLAVDDRVRSEIARLARPLPRAAHWRRSYGPLDGLVHPGLRHRVFAATFSHVKVVLRAARPPRVKSYVELGAYQPATP